MIIPERKRHNSQYPYKSTTQARDVDTRNPSSHIERNTKRRLSPTKGNGKKKGIIQWLGKIMKEKGITADGKTNRIQRYKKVLE